jgi:hypothetical protein
MANPALSVSLVIRNTWNSNIWEGVLGLSGPFTHPLLPNKKEESPMHVETRVRMLPYAHCLTSATCSMQAQGLLHL